MKWPGAKALSAPSAALFMTTSSPVSIPAFAAACLYFPPVPNSIPARVGPVSSPPLPKKTLLPSRTLASAWCAPRCSAPDATLIWATFSRTAPNQPDCGIASIPPPWCSPLQNPLHHRCLPSGDPRMRLGMNRQPGGCRFFANVHCT